jgi:hypothetical protein
VSYLIAFSTLEWAPDGELDLHYDTFCIDEVGEPLPVLDRSLRLPPEPILSTMFARPQGSASVTDGSFYDFSDV